MAHPSAEQPLGEFALIRALQRRFARRKPALVRGIGDDAAVLAVSSRQWWHVTTDLLVEHVHFDLRTASPESVGYRAGMANLSDLAAMGALPRYSLISLAIPPSFRRPDVVRLYKGMMEACRPHGVTLIGGDTSASRSGLFLNITLIGTTARGQALLRSGARNGDLIYVTGRLGDSLAGLQLLDGATAKKRRRSTAISPAHRRYLIARHLRPTARVREGCWLNTAGLATAAIDISDGLSGDLHHVCEESGLGAELQEGAIPLSSACRAYARATGQNPTHLALEGGEDYELLFTVPPAKQTTLERQAGARGFRITCIGTMTRRRKGLRLLSQDGSRPIPITSYEHFRS